MLSVLHTPILHSSNVTNFALGEIHPVSPRAYEQIAFIVRVDEDIGIWTLSVTGQHLSREVIVTVQTISIKDPLTSWEIGNRSINNFYDRIKIAWIKKLINQYLIQEITSILPSDIILSPVYMGYSEIMINIHINICIAISFMLEILWPILWQ